MAQPGRKGPGEMPTQPYIMPDERRAPGRAASRGGDVRRRVQPNGYPSRRSGGRPSGRRPGARAGGAVRESRESPRRRAPRRGPLHRPGRMGRARGAPLGRWRPRFGSTQARRWRAFIALVVVPVLLMLGSIYVHAAAAGISERVAELEQSREMAEVRQENLDLRLTGLTAPDRIRSEASDLGLREPVGNLKVYGSQGEDGTDESRRSGEGQSR